MPDTGDIENSEPLLNDLRKIFPPLFSTKIWGKHFPGSSTCADNPRIWQKGRTMLTWQLDEENSPVPKMTVIEMFVLQTHKTPK